jgi:hypothetical protein
MNTKLILKSMLPFIICSICSKSGWADTFALRREAMTYVQAKRFGDAFDLVHTHLNTMPLQTRNSDEYKSLLFFLKTIRQRAFNYAIRISTSNELSFDIQQAFRQMDRQIATASLGVMANEPPVSRAHDEEGKESRVVRFAQEGGPSLEGREESNGFAPLFSADLQPRSLRVLPINRVTPPRRDEGRYGIGSMIVSALAFTATLAGLIELVRFGYKPKPRMIRSHL